jgi:hypothetical protein
LATLADLVVPFLILWVLVAPFAGRRRAAAAFWLRTGAGLAFVYLVHGLDRALGLWASAGLDYSTHTAVAVALAAALAARERRWLLALAPLLAGYALLMVRLGYHSWADIGTTALLVAPVAWLCQRAWRHRYLRA